MNINRSEKPIIQRVIGQTKTSGFQIGARRTFLVSVPNAWNFLISEQGQSIWLGDLAASIDRGSNVYDTEWYKRCGPCRKSRSEFASDLAASCVAPELNNSDPYD
jgi:hypothetical protein